MEEKSFVWTSELTKRLFELRFENDWLFKKLKQPWGDFFKILQENGFPEEMTIQHVRKKWSYTYDSYKIAKKTKNKDWKYYTIFDKHFGKTKVLDKYESWNDEWRLKLIMCISEAKEMKIDFQNMWRLIERALRCQDLPIDCCIQDIKGLWHHIKMTFNRKHRLKTKKGAEHSEWPLYGAMLEYFLVHDREYLERLERDPAELADIKKSCKRKGDGRGHGEGHEFQWSKDITESFIQIRLQQDWLFRQRKWAWNELRNIMIEEFGFPKSLTSRELSRKWAATFAEFQKAKATNNKTWVYYQLFELYLGEGSLSLNPLVGWQEEWVLSLISARCECEAQFQPAHRDRAPGWREVEKKLRTIGIPLDHSLLDLEEIWIHLLKTYRWKRKFADKGILNEQWPYFEAMSNYVESRPEEPAKKQRYELSDVHDDDDDVKLQDPKECVKPKQELSQCRCCAGDDGCISIFEVDDQGVELALKLKAVGGVEVEQSDALPSHICLPCFNELEAAYKFRRRCQSVDRGLRGAPIKMEAPHEVTDCQDTDHYEPDLEVPRKPIKMERKKKRVRRLRYDYWKICEVCGKHTKNLMSHLDTHSDDKGYSCDVCEKRFKFKSGLIIHRAVHDPTPKKTCEVCGKTFHILAQYRRHFVYHANERKYGCETCGKRFNTMDILKVHNRSHTDERPFSCVDCGKTFRTAGCVSRHKKIVHRNLKQ